jgi:hypothetical protein
MPVTATLRKAKTAPTDASAPQPAAGAAGAKPSLASQMGASDPIEVAAEVHVETPSTAVATRTANSVAAPSTYNVADANDGFDNDDIKLATLKIVAGSGPSSLKFNVGSLVLGEEALFNAPDLRPGASNPVLRFVPLLIKKQWREVITQEDYEAGVMPRIANSPQEVAALGGTTQWVNGIKPSWGKSAKCVFLVEEPEGSEHPGFSIQIGGKKYALAVFYAANTAYKESAQVIFNAAQMWPRDAQTNKLVWHKRFWTLRVSKKQVGSFSVWVPVLALTKEDTGPEVHELACQINGVALPATTETE